MAKKVDMKLHEETRKDLNIIKAKLDFKSHDDTIKFLILYYKEHNITNTNLGILEEKNK